MVNPVASKSFTLSCPSLFQGVQWLGRKISLMATDLWRRIVAYVRSLFGTPQTTFHPLSRLAIVRKDAVQFDPAMQQLQAFLTNFATLAGNSVYNQIVAPVIKTFASNPQLSPALTAALNTLSASIANYIAGAILQILGDASSTATGELKLLLSWLLHGKSSQNVSNAVQTALLKTFKPDLVSQFISWLNDPSWLAKDAPIPSLKTACTAAPDNGTLQSLLASAIQTLINTKVTAYLQNLSQSLGGQLNTILQQAIQQNSTLLGQTLSLRFATLIQASAPLSPPANLPTIYQQSYDQIVNILYTQVNAIVNAAKTANATNLPQIFSKDDACDPNVRQMLNPPAGVDPATYTATIEQKICAATAARLIALLLPDETSQQGNIAISVPGIVVLLRQLQFPEQLQNAFNDLLALPEDLFPAGATPTVELILGSVKYFFEKGAASILSDQINAGLTMGLQLGMQYVVPPSYLSMWMVQGAFPALIQALIQGILCNVIMNPPDDVVKAFIPLASASCDRNTAIMVNLTPVIYIYVYRACEGQIDLQKMEITIGTQNTMLNMVVFGQIMTPYLNQVADYLVQNIPAGQSPNASNVKALLMSYAKPADAGSNSTYGNLLSDIMFNIGKIKLLGNEDLARWVCHNFLQNLMSRGLTSALNPLRVNEQLLVSGIVNGLNSVMSTQSQMDSLLFGPSVQATDVSAQLTTQLTQISALIDSLIRQVIDQLPNDSHWYSSPFKHLGADGIKKLLPKQTDFTNAITKTYQTILGNRYLNENLYIQAVNIVLTSLENANNQLTV